MYVIHLPSNGHGPTVNKLRLFLIAGWSAVSSTLTKEFGFVASSSGDWALDLCTYPMSIMVRQSIFSLLYKLDNRNNYFYVFS